jgi:hypothetical protein
MRGKSRRPSPALVIAIVALFVALGGTGYAASQINGKSLKNNSVPGKKLKNKTVAAGKVKPDTLTGAQIQESTLGTVPSASTAASAANATNAANAANANTLGGKSASDFATAKAEPVRIVGASGQPQFNEGWGLGGGEQVPGFWKDPFGTVYLQGQAGRDFGSEDVIFTLPPGYRPTENSYFSTYPSGGSGTVAIAVLANGDVELFNLAEPSDDNFVGLGGVVFRAAGS